MRLEGCRPGKSGHMVRDGADAPPHHEDYVTQQLVGCARRSARPNARQMINSAIPIAPLRTRSKPMGFASALPILRAATRGFRTRSTLRALAADRVLARNNPRLYGA